MQCQEFLENAEQWMEGERTAAATAHVEACPRCRGLVADLSTICSEAHKLESEVQPPARLWSSIRAQLEAEGLIHEPERAWTERWAGFFGVFSRPALAGAYLALLLVAATLVSYESANRYEQARGLAVAPSELAQLQEQFKHESERAVPRLSRSNPEVAASYRESLRTIDNSIVECERMVRQDPQNELAREYLLVAYQQKADLVTAIAERGTYGGR